MTRRHVRFVLLCEGTSDQALESHLRRLLSHCGAGEVVGTSIPLARVRVPGERAGNVLARKIATVLSADSAFDLVFVHRDAVGGALEQVPAWRRLERRVSAFVRS